MDVPPLPFAPPSLHDAPAARHAAWARAARQSDLAFANLYLLRRKYGTEVAFEEGVLFRHFGGQGRLQGYAFPCGAADARWALRRVEEDATARGREFRFSVLMEEEAQLLGELYPGRFRFEADRGDADYIYERSALAELPGARFHRKRNHLARFRRMCPSWNVVPLSVANAGDALSVASGWLAAEVAEGEDVCPALLHEHEAIAQALASQETLGLLGAVLYVEEQPAAMAVASMISPEVADVHYEKCLPAFREAYPAINQALARMLGGVWVNREEDLNQPGLRQAKLSYFPAEILTKYRAIPC